MAKKMQVQPDQAVPLENWANANVRDGERELMAAFVSEEVRLRYLVDSAFSYKSRYEAFRVRPA